MEQLSQIILEATAAIGQEYFLLPIHGTVPVYRERVYCYELYHQMRLRWPVESPYRLNGEVDKNAHPYFQNLRAGNPKPDLLVHQPGSGQFNHAVIEVKSSRAADDGIRKDIKTLSRFRNEFGYQRAVYLIYGDYPDSTLAKVQKFAAEEPSLAPIELWLHVESTTPAFLSHTLIPPR